MASLRGDAPTCLLWMLLLWSGDRGCWAQRAGGAQGSGRVWEGAGQGVGANALTVACPARVCACVCMCVCVRVCVC